MIASQFSYRRNDVQRTFYFLIMRNFIAHYLMHLLIYSAYGYASTTTKIKIRNALYIPDSTLNKLSLFLFNFNRSCFCKLLCPLLADSRLFDLHITARACFKLQRIIFIHPVYCSMNTCNSYDCYFDADCVESAGKTVPENLR